jgi:hypothetical protein
MFFSDRQCYNGGGGGVGDLPRSGAQSLAKNSDVTICMRQSGGIITL